MVGIVFLPLSSFLPPFLSCLNPIIHTSHQHFLPDCHSHHPFPTPSRLRGHRGCTLSPVRTQQYRVNCRSATMSPEVMTTCVKDYRARLSQPLSVFLEPGTHPLLLHPAAPAYLSARSPNTSAPISTPSMKVGWHSLASHSLSQTKSQSVTMLS